MDKKTKLIVSDVKTEHRFIKKSKELTDIVTLMKKHGFSDDPMSLLPSAGWYYVEFILKNTYASFANAIRRVLIGEIPVRCLTLEESDLETDDEFILSDLLIKNVNLIPIIQLDEKHTVDYTVILDVKNNTNEIIDVKASDFVISLNDVKKSLSLLIPESNIIIIRLRPGKYLKIKKLSFIEGTSDVAAAKFSLLDNVSYDIISDIKPYDMFTETGTRSMEYDPTEFKISFTTSGNIEPAEVIRRCCATLTERLEKTKEKLQTYMKSDLTKKYYFAEGFEVKIDDVTEYRIIGEYITLAYMIAQRCFLIDQNVLRCVPAVDRYDNNIAIVKLKHADGNELLLNSIDQCITDVATFKAAF